ncbi:MAG: hypothetical protein KC449_29975, partial [Anaerolineales bacterium]|nr:hypothetical protein [Anaerolineales bacterium]
MTQLAVVDLNSLLLVGNGSVAPTLLDPPGPPAAAQAYFESREGMLVSLPVTGTVVGPTSFGTVTVIPGDEGVTRVF